MLDSLRKLRADHPGIGDVRGRGLMIGLELVDPEAAPLPAEADDHAPAPPPDPALARAVQQECLDRGLIVELGGRQSAVVRLLPPLTLTDEQASAVVDRLADALAAAERSPHRRAAVGLTT
jgi:diaminobutyrate-2-oxoglutarate transaminase